MVGTGRLKEETARDRLGTGEGQVRDMLGTGSGHAVPRTWQARDRLGTRRPWDWKARDTLGTGFEQAKDRPWTSEGQARDSRAATEGGRAFLLAIPDGPCRNRPGLQVGRLRRLG